MVRVFARVETAEPNEPSPEHGGHYTADRRVGYTVEGGALVDSQTNQELASLGKLDRYFFSSNGQHLVATSHAEANPVVHVWDARTGQLRFTINDCIKQITVMQFHPGQALLLIAFLDRTIRLSLWSLETGAEVARHGGRSRLAGIRSGEHRGRHESRVRNHRSNSCLAH